MSEIATPARTEPAMHLRFLTLLDTADIDLVAQRMRATLVEVEGEAAGGGMYSMDWLRDRVRWHLDGRAAEVVVIADDDGEVVGHTIYRREEPDGGLPFGLISTTYVAPEARRLGAAQRLLARAEDWFRAQGLQMACTWTSSTNTPLIALYGRNGYVEAERGANEITGTMMVRLAKALEHEGRLTADAPAPPDTAARASAHPR